MKWVKSSVEIIGGDDAATALKRIELGCRTCYKSEDKIGEGTAEKLIRNCLKRGHESPLEHSDLTFRIICDRGVTHEIVRHRLASYSQESTRYCNYSHDKFGNELTFVYPAWLTIQNEHHDMLWTDLTQACQQAEQAYFTMLQHGAKPEEARAVLPNCLKTEIVMTMNMRELRHFIRLRSSKAAHPDIRKIAIEMLNMLREKGYGVLFEDIEVDA